MRFMQDVIPDTKTVPSPPLQLRRKLQVGSANDPCEVEADQVADQIVQRLDQPSHVDLSSAQHVGAGNGRINRAVRGDAADVAAAPAAPIKIRRLENASAGGFTAPAAVESEINQARGRGTPIDTKVRSRFEGAMGTDLGAVRVHRDASADRLARSVSAKAFTTGNDVFFSKGAYAPDTSSGQSLLAHELTHVVQQGSAVHRRLLTGTRSDDDRKRMNAEGGNPKSDRADPPHSELAEEEESESSEETVAEVPEDVAESEMSEEEAEEKTKAIREAASEYRAAHDRSHRKKKATVARRRSAQGKVKGQGKGRVAIAGSAVATGAERVGNEGKHGFLNIGRSLGRLVGMDVNPSTNVKMTVGANTTDTAQGAYGACDTEFIEPQFTVKLVGTTWEPILTSLKGTYGKITAPLPGGKTEVTGPDANDSKRQIRNLLNLGGPWYMSKAVDAHESVHEDHMHDALNNVGGDIAQLFATLTVDQSVAPTQKDAIAAIKLLPGYDAIMNLADPNDSQIRGLWDDEYVDLIDRDHYGPTETAEADIVEPMINKINAWRKKSKLKKIKKTWTCENDDDVVEIPKGRKNP